MTVKLRVLRDALYLGRKPKEWLPRLEAAISDLDAAWIDFGSYKRRVVMVSEIPSGPKYLDGRMRLVVDLLPGAADGPVVSPNLAAWGVRSAAAYRAADRAGLPLASAGRHVGSVFYS